MNLSGSVWRRPLVPSSRNIGRLHPVAKATYVKAQDVWKVFWQRADLKWHRYDPCSLEVLGGEHEKVGFDRGPVGI
ncbi:MAG: DUF3024 domain-containing protein [Burkholderiales bacterium]